MKVLAIDYGDSRIGLALSDMTMTLTGKTLVIRGGNDVKAVGEIEALVREERVSELVLGYPKNMNATTGERARKSETFAALLEKRVGLTVTLWDERLTTVSAHRILSDTGRKMKLHKKDVDAVAAALILEGYLARRALQKGQTL